MIAWILVGCGQPATVPAAAGTHYGAPFSVAEAVPASAVLADPGSHAGKPLRMKGELTEVCQKMGCWAVVRDDAGHSVRVTMKDHAFGMDEDGAGKSCDVEGELVSEAVDPEKLAHYASEGAKHHPEAGQTESWELVASAVEVGG